MAEKKVRIAVINYDKCQPEACGRFLCERICPVNRTGKECIVIDEERKQPILSEELCIGCQICSTKCPLKAISIVNISAELTQPIHQYGKNAFRLYRMPYPKKGAVVGLIGKNGIGKTTVLKILSGKITPNLGELEEGASLKRVIDFFKGKELMNFFEELNKGKAKLSYKPQSIDFLPEKVKGKVNALLKKADERKKLKEAVELLELTPILDHSLKDLSGGELQRIAIAVTFLREADYYFFDEPSSFLDVRQRLNAAKIINSLAAEGKSVMLVEHDLAVLDYLSEYIHVFYGRPAVYGVVSSVKSVRNGINEFLEGYLKDENTRFREKELRFEVRPPSKSKKNKSFLQYPALEKKFPSFSLKTSPGELMQGEVIGVLGPNAIGKTTFIKMLASAIKPDNTKLDFNLKVSFKPQKIESKEKLSVRELLSGKEIDKELFKSEIEKKLQINELMDLKLNELSGGELQKVAVSLALCREADLVLLDEPSAFIDVEERLKMADIIRNVIEKKNRVGVIVDHDILFIDYISDRLIIFNGSPSKKGSAGKPTEMHEGMNSFLESLQISFRRDSTTGRPRANKLDSVKDREQKEKREYYYSL
ncbi:MAG: ribosome biogenesis/translation initiation ATPase RLI [archaeon]